MKIRCNARGAVAAASSLILFLALVVSPASGSAGWGVGPLFHLDTRSPDLPLTVGGLKFDGETIVPAGPDQWRIEGSVQVGGLADPVLPLHLGVSSIVTVDLAQGMATVQQYADLELHQDGHVFRLSAQGALSVDPSAADPDNASVNWGGRLYALGDGGDLGIEGQLAFRPNLYSLRASGGSFFGLDGLFGPGALLEFDGDVQLSQMCVRFTVDVDVAREIPILVGTLTIPFEQSVRLRANLDLTNRFVEFLLLGSLMEVEGTGGSFGLGCWPLPLSVCGGIRFPISAGAPAPDLRVLEHLKVTIPIPIVAMREQQSAADDSSKIRAWSPVSVGIDVKGSEVYEDLNCNAQYDLGEPFDDNVIQDGVWTDGSRIWMDHTGLNMQANATIAIGLLSFVKIRAAQAEVRLDWASETFEMSLEGGFEMGPEEHPWFHLRGSGDDYLRIVWGGPNREVRFRGEVRTLQMPGVTLRSEMGAAWGPDGFGRLEGTFGADVRLLDLIDLNLAQAGFYVDRNGMEFSASIAAPFETGFSGAITDDRISGTCTTDFSLFGRTLIGGETRATIDGSCLTLDARSRLGCMSVDLQAIWCAGWPVPRIGAGTGFALCCPADLHYYDSQGRHVGRNPATGLIEIEIPGACYIESADHEGKYIGLPGMDWEGSSRLVVEALDEGQFDLSVMVPDVQGGKETFADYQGIAIGGESIAELPFSARGDLNLLLDLDGDGQVDQVLAPDSLVLADLDTSMIRIEDLDIQNITPHAAEIGWRTNVLAGAMVAYGQGEDFPDTARVEADLSYVHHVVLAGLLPDSTYRFVAVSTDSLGRPARSFPQEFRTLPLGFTRSDVDASGELDISDPIYSLAYQFAGGPPPACLDAADDDDSGEVNISDPIYSLYYQFAGGAPPPAPFPGCGSDPTADQIGCGQFPPCDGKARPTSQVTKVLDGSKRIVLEMVPGTSTDTLSYMVTVVTDVPLAALEGMAEFDPSRLQFVRLVQSENSPRMDFLSARNLSDPARVRLGGVPDFGLTRALEPGTHDIGRLVFARQGPAVPLNGAVWLTGGRFVQRNLVAYLIEGGPVDDPAVPATPGGSTGAGFVIVFQNPYHPNGPIGLRLAPSLGEVDIAVYDIQGRRVRSLYVGSLRAVLNLAWDGHADGGYEVAAGLYYLRVNTGFRRETRGLILLK